MINFDALTLKAFISENYDYLKNAAIRKIQQPSRREIILHLRNNGENKKFYININPEFFHICFSDKLQDRGVFVPNEAPMFCMLLRKYILNSKISEVKQPFGERILELYFEYKDALNETVTLCLAIELMGKYSNIVLYNKNDGIIIGCAHNVGEEKSKYRELAGTLPYIYPEKQNKKDILNTNFEDFYFSGNIDENSFAYSVASEYFYITVPMVKQVIKYLEISDFNRNSIEKIYKKLQDTVSLRDFQPSCDKNFDEFSLVKNEQNNISNSVNEMIDNYFGQNQLKKILKQRKSSLYTNIDNQSKKLLKQIDIFKSKLSDIEKADNYRIKGDILMMNINIPVKEKVKLLNPYDNNLTEIELDERYSVTQNANRYYKLYKKTKSAVDYASSRIEELEEQLSELEEQKFYTDIASTVEEVNEISQELGIKTTIEAKKNKKETINLENYEIQGFKVYLGKNSTQNDYLLSKVASPTDYWFHPLNMHGAHVILKRNNFDVPEEVILFCAKLAKRFAKNNNEAKIPIIYTERKYVKKAKAKIAFVTYKNEKEIYC